MSHSLELVSTYKLVKPHIGNLLWHVALPILSFSAKDHELWTTDPEDYVRGQLDPMDALVDPRTSASEFIINLLKVGNDTQPRGCSACRRQLLSFMFACRTGMKR